MTGARDERQHLSQRQRLDALGLLAGGVAHDLNNLLAVIIGNGEALARELGEGDGGELARLILAAGERAAELTDGLLTFARRQSLQPRPVVVGELIDSLLPLLERAVPDGIALRLAACDAAPSIHADRAKLEAALLDLVRHAGGALPLGGWIELAAETVEVTRSSRRGDLAPGSYAMLSLRDNGAGLSEEAAEHAFDPFFPTAASAGGLGLSVAYGFARQSGGQVEVVSWPGEGTVLRLYLPATAATPCARGETADDGADRDRDGETVLIAEDDPMVRKFVASQVGSLGYRTIATADGKAALDVLRGAAAIDLLFTDIAMDGGMDGIELAGRARVIRPGLPVLFTSGHAGLHGERLNEIDALLLKKPYRKKDLADHLRRALQPDRRNAPIGALRLSETSDTAKALD